MTTSARRIFGSVHLNPGPIALVVAAIGGVAHNGDLVAAFTLLVGHAAVWFRIWRIILASQGGVRVGDESIFISSRIELPPIDVIGAMIQSHANHILGILELLRTNGPHVERWHHVKER